MTWLRRRRVSARRDHRGSATPLNLMLGLGFVVFPVMLLVLMIPTWEQRSVIAEDMARNAARAAVTADTWSDGRAAAAATAGQIAAGDGLGASQYTFGCTGSLQPAATVTCVVVVQIPVGQLPYVGRVGTLHYSASSTEHVDDYRSVTP